MKLSTIWEDFDEFVDLCSMSGTIDTKYKIKIIKTFFNEHGEFEGNWQNLFDNIIYIFVNDKKIAYKFDYSKPFVIANQEMFSEKNPTSYGVRKGLFEKLRSTHKVINENGDIQFFNAVNKNYITVDSIYLTPTINIKNQKVDIQGSTIKNEKDYFVVTFGEHKILITYIKEKFESAVNSITNKNVRISKYPEIIHFINAKYYGLYINKLSYNSFKYLVLSYSEIKPFLLVPTNNNGYLSSSLTSQYIKSLSEANEYFKNADEKFENIRFSYRMIAFNKFEIIREENKDIQKNIEHTQNEYGDMKAKLPFSPRATERTFKK